MPEVLGTGFNYKVVAASQTTSQICEPGGVLHTLTVIPASSTPQTVALIDGSTTLFTIVTGAGGDTKPYTLVLDIVATSTTGGFKITTGASVSCIVSGRHYASVGG